MNRPALKAAPWALLFGRTALFLTFQALFALAYRLAGAPQAWTAGAAWWPAAVTLANVVCLGAMLAISKKEGLSYWSLFALRRERVGRDLLALAGTLLIAGPAGYFPNILLAGWLFSDSTTALNLLVMPLPRLAAYSLLVIFPLTQALVELPLYFRFVQPRLESQRVPAWLALTLCAVMLGLQHIAAPFQPVGAFILWRGLMFLPFAFVAGGILRWKPGLLPYMAVIHFLMDFSFAMMLLPVMV